MQPRPKLPTVTFLTAMALTAALTSAQQPSSILTEDTVKISDHVWVIIGNPNIAIIVGSRATLVVDTGMGARNGATISRVVAKLSSNPKLFLTTTHFHPEHASGEPGFPPNTILIRDAVQQQEMELHGQEMIDSFSSRSALNKELLAGPKLRQPDVLFDSEAKLDLGGVTARLLYLGGAHTKGDELTFVEPDRTLVSGDVVQNKVIPTIYGDGGTPSSWLAVVEKLVVLNASHVVPDHSAPGDGGLVTAERNLISDLRTRALALKGQGLSQEDAGKQLTAEFKVKYPDWPNTNVTGFVQRIYAEN